MFTGLFALRVVAQFTQYIFQTDFLPAFEQWQGSQLPYPVLLVMQVLILLIMFILNVRVTSGKLKANRFTGKLVLVFSVVYFISMAVRLLLGLSLYADNAWYAKWIPAVFHLVLASYVLVLGFYHVRNSRGVA